MKPLLIAVVLLAVGLAEAQAQFAISETRPVDSSFKLVTVKGRTASTGEYEKLHYFKIFEKDARLSICGAVTANVTTLTQNAIVDGLRNLRTVLVVGRRDDEDAPKISPLPFVQFNSFSLPKEQMQANCIVTDVAWKSDYARRSLYLHTGAGIGR